MSKTKVFKQTYIDACFSILESGLSDMEKFAALMNYASKFEIASEAEVFNQLLKTK